MSISEMAAIRAFRDRLRDVIDDMDREVRAVPPEVLPDADALGFERTSRGFQLTAHWDGDNLKPLRQILGFMPKNAELRIGKEGRAVICTDGRHHEIPAGDSMTIDVVIGN